MQKVHEDDYCQNEKETEMSPEHALNVKGDDSTKLEDCHSPIEPSPMDKAGWLNRMVLHWISPILKRGHSAPLVLEDLPAVPSGFETAHLEARLLADWQRRLTRIPVSTSIADDPPTSPNHINPQGPKSTLLLGSLCGTFGRRFALAGILKMVGDLCAISSPYLLRLMIQSISADDITDRSLFQREAFWLCLGLFALQLANTLTVNIYFQLITFIGCQMRTGLTGLIYRKALRLSGRARRTFSTGQIVNLMSTDTQRIESVATYLHYLWSAVLQCLLIMAALTKLLGMASFVGFGLFVLCIPLQSKLVTWLSQYRKETSSLTDQRVKYMQEILYGIRVIKFYAWEPSFLEKVRKVRKEEVRRVLCSQLIRTLINGMTILVPVFACILSFLAYLWMDSKRKLTADIIFPSLAYYALLRLPLILFPMVVGMVVDARVAIKRIQAFLLADELEFEAEVLLESNDPWAIQIKNGQFVWEPEVSKEKKSSSKTERTSRNSPSPNSKTNLIQSPSSSSSSGHANFPACLINLNIKIRKGDLVAVIGAVGSGKSSLLAAIVDEMRWVDGSVKLATSSVGYCQQQAWIQNATIRENILFGAPFNPERYAETIRACALERDVSDHSVLPQGDATLIGEKGVTLSGGQKQRIALARLVYLNPDIVLLDDPLSAVDAHVGRFLFDQCINGILAGKTRILVTHQLHLLSKCDQIIIMERLASDNATSMSIRESGTFLELMKSSPRFANLLRRHVGSDGIVESEFPSEKGNEDDLDGEVAVKKESKEPTGIPSKRPSEEEERAFGSVSSKVYGIYVRSAGGSLRFILPAVISAVCLNGSKMGTDMWLSFWSSSPPRFNLSMAIWMGVYVAWGSAQGIFAFINGLVYAFAGVRAAMTLHDRALWRLLHTPISFFDLTPSGRIINRFSRDQDALDNLLTDSLRGTISMIGITLSTLALIVWASQWYFCLPLAALMIAYWAIQRYYRASSRELKRIDSVSRSPIYAHFGETLAGLATIRAYRQQNRFILDNARLVDTNNRASILQLAIQRWLAIRLESLGNLLILAAGLSCLVGRVGPSMTGLALGYALGMTGTLTWLIRQLTDTETQVIAAERLGQYAEELELEGNVVDFDRQPLPATSWQPMRGEIEFRNYSLRYRPDLPLVLRSISLKIHAGERIGIAGRTGAGKSSMLMALFQMVRRRKVSASETEDTLTAEDQGEILIDGTPISQIPLAHLRRSISIIPQEPILFSGTVRSNLDPTTTDHSQDHQHQHNQHHPSTYSDEQMWRALEAAHLSKKIGTMPGGLDGLVSEGGENFSIGERQLLCLARALLRRDRNRILVLDEATANIDPDTDALIQASLRRDFTGTTVLTIAHRIGTIRDCDRVMVLEAGRVVEFDSPAELLQQRDSHFAKLVASSSGN